MGRRKKRRKGLRNKPFKLKLKKETASSVFSTILFALGGLSILSFAQQGSLLASFNNFLLKLFSWGALFLPFLLFSAGLTLTRLRWRVARPNVFLGGLLFFASLVGLTKAGLIGFQIWAGLASLITGVGALIVLLGSFFVGLVVLFETSLEEMILITSGIFKSFNKNINLLLKGKKDGQLFSQQKAVQIKGLEPKMPDKDQDKGVKSQKEEELKAQLVSNPQDQAKDWHYPPLSILNDSMGGKADRGDLKENAAVIEKTLESFGIEARVIEVNCGPAVTQYALEIALGTKLSKITALSNDLALALAAPTGQIRIEAPIPGRSLVGVEIPNRSLEFVTLKNILTSDSMKKSKSKLTVGLGLDVSGTSLTADISKMPHVLIAGSTGSGKSVAINSFIATILFRANPNEVKLILVDPKRVELTQYNGIPHLLTPVIVEPEKVISALKWAVSEMERRYKVFAERGSRNIEGYNETAGFQEMPYIVIIIDELADIMFFAPSEVEDTITRIAQMARATGIHLIVSTQRPSVDVITGLIKANIPCRIAFNVSSMVDSRVIIDMPGAEKLLGRGDMLYIPPNQAKPTRIQGTYVADKEIKDLIKTLKESGVEPRYTEEVTSKYKSKIITSQAGQTGQEIDDLFSEAIRIVCQYDRASASLLQRRLSIGYARAARILDQLEASGVVSPAEGSKPRDVLIQNAEEFLAQRED
ncbi:DNA translocase FtsK [Candidatus Beckwithbacteria bacterium CG10_big_fil_rev_8_21_14_0_10_34_10]|uniref:DNA translocase FtsK n=1 Tax=Candidatus Beckwithbacteria bacterium CG10_big_fil_rev_8_21_14_0_10_34_10 TaxID=1974495 RepID=A0A2H0W8X9_9BACT|nr:MAG: DNA translocase FtsK [Candidatus Beckwithbacteria bacterium CG10_big_fil_rev_8_21_14_0_10_34_10]